MEVVFPSGWISKEIVRRLKWLVRVIFRTIRIVETGGKIIIRGDREEVEKIIRIIDHYKEKDEDIVEDEDLVYPEPGPLFPEWELEEA